MPKITFDSFLNGLAAKQNATFGRDEYTIVTYGDENRDSLSLVKCTFKDNEFIMDARNEWDHGFTMGVVVGNVIEVYFSKQRTKDISIHGNVDDFISEDVQVVHHDGLRKGTILEDISYDAKGSVNEVMEKISVHKRISNDSFKRSDYFIHNPYDLIIGLVQTLSKVL